MSDLPPPSSPDEPRYPSTPPTGPPAGGWAPPGAPPAGPPLGAPIPDEPPTGGRRRVSVVAAIVAVLVLLVATFAFVTRDDADDEGSAPTTTAPTTSAPVDEEPEPVDPVPEDEPITEEALAVLVEELQDYVAEARGLEFLRPVEVELAADEEFEARLLENFEEDVSDIEDTEVFYRALGLLEGGRSLVDELRSIYSAGVLGYYDTETDELVVRGASLSPYVRQTIVHELVHALDDQHFELFRPEYEDRDDEISTGFGAVVEGNARRIEQRWLGEQPAEVREQARAEEQAFGEGIDVDAFPQMLLFVIGAPYQLGEVFVRAVHAEGGERAVDALFDDPPTTTEQVLFPPVYAAREPRIEVPAPPAEGDVVDEGVVGALFWFGLFTTGGGSTTAIEAAQAVQGWGGDWAVTWRDGDASCIRADVVGDTDDDTDELEAAIRAWAEENDAAEVSVVDDRVRLESCTADVAAGSPQV